MRRSTLPTLAADVLVLFLLTGGAFEFLSQVLGVRSKVAAVMLAFVWLRGAVTKLSEFRRGRYVPWHVENPRRAEMLIMIAAGTAPWLVVQFFLDQTGTWPEQFAVLPGWVRILGALLALVEAARSNAANRVTAPKRRLLESVRPGSCLLIAWLLMVSTSPLVGLLAAGQLMVLSICRLRRYKRRDPVIGTTDSRDEAPTLAATTQTAS